MRVAISQPEHFPYLGFFQKMCACDLFVLLDDVQFSGPRSFQNRNRYILKNGDYRWFTVPVKKGSYYQLINEVEVSSDGKWRYKLKKRLFQEIGFNDFDDVYNFNKLVDINISSIEYCCMKFQLDIPVIRSSTLDVGGKKADRIYNICKKLNADTYVAGLGSKEYMSKAYFPDIKIEFFYPKVENYESAIVYTTRNLEQTKEVFLDICNFPNLYCREE